jgi:cupin superfamily acireductone dioxygenase involved in methionine salvage
MKMKYLIIALISIAVSSCGGLESKVKKLAEKRCECEELKKGIKKIPQNRELQWAKEVEITRECNKEADDMQKEFYNEINDAKLKTAEERELKQLLEDTYKDCMRKVRSLPLAH